MSLGIWARQHVRSLLLALTLILMLGSFAFLHAQEESDVVVTVNGHAIDRATFYSALEGFMLDGEPLGRIVLQQLISEALVAEANAQFDLGVTDAMVDEEFELIRARYGDAFDYVLQQIGLTPERLRHELRLSLILDRLLLKDVQVSDEDVRAFYEENKDLFFQPELFRPLQIRVATEEEAESILEQLANGASFEALREELSLDKSDMGPFSQFDNIPPVLKETLFALQVGEVSPPIALDGGYYLIRLEEIIPARDQSFEEVADEIRQHLLYEQAPSVDEVLEKLWLDADIEVQWDRYRNIVAAVN